MVLHFVTTNVFVILMCKSFLCIFFQNCFYSFETFIVIRFAENVFFFSFYIQYFFFLFTINFTSIFTVPDYFHWIYSGCTWLGFHCFVLLFNSKYRCRFDSVDHSVSFLNCSKFTILLLFQNFCTSHLCKFFTVIGYSYTVTIWRRKLSRNFQLKIFIHFENTLV